MPAFTKRKTRLHIQLTNSDHATAHGGQLLVDALCRRAGLWNKIQAEPALEVRKRTGAGFSPLGIVAQVLFTLTSGGTSLADAERVGQDRVLMDILGLDKGADQTTIGEWLRAQGIVDGEVELGVGQLDLMLKGKQVNPIGDHDRAQLLAVLPFGDRVIDAAAHQHEVRLGEFGSDHLERLHDV